MKKLLLLSLIFVLTSSATLFSQETVKPEYSKTVKIEKQGPGHLMIAGIFEHENEMCVLTSNINLKFQYYIYVSIFSPFNTGFSLYRFNSKTKRFGTPERIYFPLDKVYYNFETYWYKNDVLNIYTSHKNQKNRKKYFFCTQYNLNTKKSTTTKVYECGLKEATTIKVSENGEWGMAISGDKKSKSAAVDYMIFDNELNVKESGSKVKLSNIAYTDIQEFELSNKGNIFIETMYKNKRAKLFAKRTYTNDIFMLRDATVTSIEPTTTGYTSYRKMFFDKEGTLKIANFYGTEKDSYEGISIADVNETTKSITNISTVPVKNENEEGKKKRARRRGDDRITTMKSTIEGNYMLLTENYLYREITTTRTSKSGTTSTTRVYHDYGPGKMYTFDKNNKLLSDCELEYKITFGEFADPGRGFNFVPIAKNNIYVQVNNTFCKYLMDKESQRIKKPSILKNTKNAYTGRFSQFLEFEDHVYLFEIKNKKSISMSSFRLE